MNVRVIRAARKTVKMGFEGEDLVLAVPARMTQQEIDAFLQKHRRWIEKHAARAASPAPAERLSMEELRALAEQALAVIPQRAAYYAPLVGVKYGHITIRNQRSRWGSCSSRGNLNFNCLLMLCPPEVMDSVVVHELCHLKQPNHSQAFYNEVLRVFPDYWACDRWLKEHGPALLRRMTG